MALIAITLAFLAIPAAIGYFAPSRWRIVVIVLWLLLPVFVVAGLVLREVTLAAAPATDFGLYTQAAEFMFVFGVLPFEIFSAAGFAGGLALRKKRAPPDANPGVPGTPQGVSKPPISARAVSPGVGQDRWVARHVGFERDGLVIDGVDIWAAEWRRVIGPPIDLPHPSYPQQLHTFQQYDLTEGPRSVRLAAAELSNGVWGFYTQLTEDVALSGVSANGPLRYENRYPEVPGPRPTNLASVAFLWNATTGCLIADASAWTSSQVAAEEGGTLLLSLRQDDRDALFRIDPAAWRFQQVGSALGTESLDQLAGALRQLRTARGRRGVPGSAYGAGRIGPR